VLRECRGSRGYTNLGASYLTGEGVPQDRAKATKLFKYGCERDVVKACSDLRVFAAPGAPASEGHRADLNL
jgi:TPR repeat protein